MIRFAWSWCSVWLWLMSFLLGGCHHAPSTADLPAVTPFNLANYLGTWYEIARLPQRFERGLNQVSATYTLKEGRLQIVNRGIRNGKEQLATAIGHFKDSPNVGDLRVSFFRPFYGDYRIIWLSQTYDCAIVTSSNRSSCWILARTPTLPKEQCDRLLQQAAAWGFDITHFEFPTPDLSQTTPQRVNASPQRNLRESGK